MKIVHRVTGATIFEADKADADNIFDLVALAIAAKIDLQGAYLQGAYLQGAYLRGADLRGADLRGADLQGAYLQGAYLQGAYLQGAYLQGAYLQGADLQGAYLQGAYLQGAYLQGAYLRGADLRGADLQPIRDDLHAVLASAPNEVAGLLQALREGRVDGSTYQGECACLVGTIANVRHCDFNEVVGLKPDSARPAERWFLAIAKGDTPATSQVASITEEWIVDWMKANPVKEHAGVEAASPV